MEKIYAFKNFIFDFGKVLVHFDPLYMVGKYTEDAEDAALVADVVFDRLYWDRLDAGTISDEEVVESSLKRLPERLHKCAACAYYNWIYNIPEIDGMREIVERIKKSGAPLYLLSNISTYFAAHKDEIPILSLFDGCVFSAL
jgi:putative hydrolase of the HAD superfamily